MENESIYMQTVALSGYYTVYSEFNIKKHKETFINYLEVIILPTGKIVYAVPSHQEYLIQFGMKKHNMNREQYMNMCPYKYCLEPIDWLTNDTRCIAVWNDRYIGHPNKLQKKALKDLIQNQLLNMIK